MKHEKRAKRITKFATTAKAFSYRVQRDNHKIEEYHFIKTKRVKCVDHLIFHDFDKYIRAVTYIPIVKEKKRAL